jgi:23S rRNA pseudouridine1911/1915/1917 synthase
MEKGKSHSNLIIYEDDSILLINKPQGLATGIGKQKNLCNLVFSENSYLLNVNGYKKEEGGLLNRLDNETGGIVLFAKHNKAFQYYHQEMKKNKVEKIYTAVVNGIPKDQYGVINYPIAHHHKNIKKMIVIKDQSKLKYRGKPRTAITEWRLLESKNNMSILQIKIKKGVRHQIRVHLAYIGLAIVGDKLYNKNLNDNFKKHLLYANGIRFIPYGKKQNIEIFIDVPFNLDQ